MKKSYQKILGLELIIFIFLMINSFVFNFLTGYKIIFFLLIILGVFKLLLGYEKDRHRYIKDIILDELIYLIIFLIAYYFLGIFIGFLKTDFLNFDSFKKFVLPNTLYIILREYFRYLALTKSEGNKYLTIITVILLIFLDITSNIYLTSFNTKYGTFVFIATIVIPAIFTNVVFSYVTKKVGYKPVLFYCLFMELYSFVLPIVPNANEYITTIIDITLPTVICYHVIAFFETIKKQKLNRETIKKKRPFLVVSLASITIAILVYFTSGYFNQWAVVVASGSMSDSINKGDMVIINKVKSNYGSIKEGKVLAYRYNGKIIIHRVVDVFEINDHYYYKTKGDANNDVDNVLIDEKMVVGVIDFKIPYIGLPTVWLKNL